MPHPKKPRTWIWAVIVIAVGAFLAWRDRAPKTTPPGAPVSPQTHVALPSNLSFEAPSREGRTDRAADIAGIQTESPAAAPLPVPALPPAAETAPSAAATAPEPTPPAEPPEPPKPPEPPSLSEQAKRPLEPVRMVAPLAARGAQKSLDAISAGVRRQNEAVDSLQDP